MISKLRVPLFIAAFICILMAVLAEVGSGIFLKFSGNPAVKEALELGGDVTGLGIPTLAWLDGLLLLSISLMGLALLLPDNIHAKIQGIITLIVSLCIVIGGIAVIFITLAKLLLMLALLLAPIFGTIAYFALYASFNTGGARAMLASIMLLKLLFAAFLIFAHQRFLQATSLIIMILFSLLANLIISFLHGIVPGFLVSITDAVAALVVAVIAVVWAVMYLAGSLISIVKSVH